jgi:hypothetical protein
MFRHGNEHSDAIGQVVAGAIEYARGKVTLKARRGAFQFSGMLVHRDMYLPVY